MNIKAFARAGSEFDSSGDWVPAGRQDGMTLRDYFAAKAMQGLVENANWRGMPEDALAKESYKLADAMLKARGE
jgi:hypothetical protein